MITCPDCGQTAPDEARFCEQCGRGLHDIPPAAALPPLAPGHELAARFRIVELISASSEENRYRAVALNNGARSLILRERSAPPAQTGKAEQPPLTEPPQSAARCEEDPTSPQAKTRDLSPLAKTATEAPALDTDTEAGRDACPTVHEPQTAGEHSDPSEPVVLDGEAGAGQAAAQTHEAAESAPQQANPIEGQGDVQTAPAIAEPADSEEPIATHDGQLNPAAVAPVAHRADLGELFERVLALSLTITHPAFQRAREGFAEDGRAYLVYDDDRVQPFARGQSPAGMNERQALNVAIQLCQAISYLHNRGMRLNDICPASLAYGADGRIKLTSLDYVSNDDELQSTPILNDGYTAPEIYRGKHADKRADVFSVGCVLYTCLTGERLECETWREEAGPVHFYPPHVVTPELEQAVRRALAFRAADRWPTADQFKTELLKLNAQFQVRSGGLSHVGMVREHNEDSIMALEFVQDSQIAPGCYYLYVVSDGMGGAAAGETASAIAVATIGDFVKQWIAPEFEGGAARSTGGDEISGAARTPAEILQAALEEANRRVIEYQAAHPEDRGMGATAVSVLVTPPDAAIAWVGDSRAYLWERGVLRQLTKDHSLVQRLVEIGQITAEQARHHEHKNVITRSLGARAGGVAGAEALSLKLKRGDRLMLCSDGLTAHVEDSRIAEIMGRQNDAQAASRELVVAANAGGGTDNISVIVIAAE